MSKCVIRAGVQRLLEPICQVLCDFHLSLRPRKHCSPTHHATGAEAGNMNAEQRQSCRLASGHFSSEGVARTGPLIRSDSVQPQRGKCVDCMAGSTCTLMCPPQISTTNPLSPCWPLLFSCLECFDWCLFDTAVLGDGGASLGHGLSFRSVK